MSLLLVLGLCVAVLFAQLRARRWRRAYERVSRQRDEVMRLCAESHAMLTALGAFSLPHTESSTDQKN